jgi:hypothetical protein
LYLLRFPFRIATKKQDQVAEEKAPRGNTMQTAVTAFDPVSAALQQLHQAVASEAVPDDFLRLLEEIDAKIAAAARLGTKG